MKAEKIQTLEDSQNFVEGVLNDFESGITDKEESLSLLGEYTARLMELFWVQAKTQIKENPALLDE